MSRSQGISVWAALLAFAGLACGTLLGGVDVNKATPEPKDSMGALQPEPAAPAASGIQLPPIQIGTSPEGPMTVPIVEPPARAETEAGEADGGIPSTPPDAAVPASLPRPILVDTPTPLALVGIVGGGPRLGTCQGGVVVGVRVTANPSADAFGQRLTFIEPLCASASVLDSPVSPTILVTPDDAIVNWSTSDAFLGVPSTEVPDPRLVWVPQAPALCPDSAPVLVGLSGEYDPVAPDDTETAALRSLVIECAPLVLAENGVDVQVASSGHLLISQADSFSATGSERYQSSCADGSAVSQIQLHSGFWLDGFVLGCSTLRAPQAAGAPCAAGRDCLSGACSAAGSCGP